MPSRECSRLQAQSTPSCGSHGFRRAIRHLRRFDSYWAFYGMEKFEAAFPKSVRGTFMQGAPIAEDVAAGRDGRWPLPSCRTPYMWRPPS